MNVITRLFRKLTGRPIKVIPITDEQVVARYVLAGAEFGDVVSMIYLGECIGFEGILNAWEEAERDYAALGFRTCSLDDFIDHGAYDKELKGLNVPRDIGEGAVYHAAYYRKHFFKNLSAIIDFDRMKEDGQVQTGTYLLPSTEHLKGK